MAHKHKKVNPNPIIQKTQVEFFLSEKEEMPLWLKNHKKGDKVNMSVVLESRTVYYPASCFDGEPIRTFNKSHSAHFYIYVDYGYKKERVDGELSDNAFSGYHIYHQQEVTEKEISPPSIRFHINREEMQYAIDGYDMSINQKEGFAILKIYERNEDLGDEHGAFRFAILYIGGDANATYDVLFGNTHRTPFACIVCNNMGSGCTCFTKGSLLELIAEKTNRFPKYLICVEEFGWSKYIMLKNVGYAKGDDGKRFVWENTDFMDIDPYDGLDEYLKKIIVFRDDKDE